VSRIHRARRLVLQGLCCLDVQGAKVRDLVADFLGNSRDDAHTVRLAKDFLDAVLAEQDQCDAILAQHARHWHLARLALVDRNILRMGVHELRQGAASPGVIITEAIKLAQEFSTADSPRFVNGVLDAVAKDISRGSGDTEDETEMNADEHG